MTYLDIDGTRAPTYGEKKAGMDASPTLCTLAETLHSTAWQPLERGPKYETLTDHTRQRNQANEKERIVKERGYLNLKLHHEDMA
jgi:hypothetical protein